MSFIVHTAGTGRKAVSLAVGLRWTVIDTDAKQRQSNARIRSEGNQIGASKYVINPVERSMYGFYTDPVSIAGARPVFGMTHAVSILFLTELSDKGAGSESAVLLMLPEAIPQKRALVILDAGAIVVDALSDQEAALEQVKQRLSQYPETHFYSQFDETGFTGNPITWELLSEIATATKKNSPSQLKALPASPILPSLLGVAFLGVLGIYAYQKLIAEPEAQRKAILTAQEKDKTPAYVQAVDAELSNAGWDRDDLKSALNEIRLLPAFVSGWKLVRVECNQGTCNTKWGRRGGLLTQLKKGISDMEFVFSESSTETVVLKKLRESKPQVWDRTKLQSYQETQEILHPVFQTFANAGMTATSSDVQRWTGGGLDGVSPNALISRFDVGVIVPFFRAVEALDMLPPGVLIKSFTLTLGDSNAATIEMKGIVYVK